MNIRRYEEKDLDAVLQLFYDSVHAVCARDYTKEQLFAWADGNPNRAEWNASLSKNETYVAEENGTVIGFADLENKNYLNRLYVHKDFQRQGVAAALCEILEQSAVGDIVVHASITAKPFFVKRGYIEKQKQRVLRRGVWLENYVMVKLHKR